MGKSSEDFGGRASVQHRFIFHTYIKKAAAIIPVLFDSYGSAALHKAFVWRWSCMVLPKCDFANYVSTAALLTPVCPHKYM